MKLGGGAFSDVSSNHLNRPDFQSKNQVLLKAFRQVLKNWGPFSTCSLVTLTTSALQSTSKIIKINLFVKTEEEMCRKCRYLLFPNYQTKYLEHDLFDFAVNPAIITLFFFLKLQLLVIVYKLQFASCWKRLGTDSPKVKLRVKLKEFWYIFEPIQVFNLHFLKSLIFLLSCLSDDAIKDCHSQLQSSSTALEQWDLARSNISKAI